MPRRAECSDGIAFHISHRRLCALSPTFLPISQTDRTCRPFSCYDAFSTLSANQLLVVLLDLIPYSPHNNTLSAAQNLTTPFGGGPSQNSRQRPRVAPYSRRVTVLCSSCSDRGNTSTSSPQCRRFVFRKKSIEPRLPQPQIPIRRRGRSVGYWAPSPWYYMRLYPPHPFTPCPHTDAWGTDGNGGGNPSTNSINAPHA
ncbi:hypothetical protein Ddc_04977 [Ditylenchus destructor]|nr:hypothetical protein Ddc_04977 [Ditylenchus destructor]